MSGSRIFIMKGEHFFYAEASTLLKYNERSLPPQEREAFF